MAWGLWARATWARAAQIAIAIVGLPLIPFSLAAIATLIAMLSGPVKAEFANEPAPADSHSTDVALSAGVAGTAILGALLSLAGGWIGAKACAPRPTISGSAATR
jgi:hypothetical protein